MSSENTLKALKNWDDRLILEVVDQLNEIGIVSDEDEQGFPSIWIEYWDDRCSKYFRQFGYEGGNLGHHAKFYPGYGAVYALFDENQHDLKSAEDYLLTKVEAL